MAIQLGSFVSSSSFKKNSFNRKHVNRHHLDVNKSHSNLIEEFKKSLRALKTNFAAALEGEEPQDPVGTKFKLAIFKDFTTKASSTPDDIYMFLSDVDVKSMTQELKNINDNFLKKKNNRILILDAVYVGKKGSKHYIELEKGKTLIQIANHMTAANQIARAVKFQFMGKGKAPKTENTSLAAQEIGAIQNDTTLDQYVASFNVSYDKFIAKAETITEENAKQSLMFLEMPLKKMQKVFKQIIAKGNVPAPVLAELKPKFAECKERFVEIKKMTASPDAMNELVLKLRELGQDVRDVRGTNYTLENVLDLSASLQMIGVTPSYKSLLKNQEKIKKGYKQLKLVIGSMANDAAVKIELMRILNDTGVFFEDYNNKVDGMWSDFSVNVEEVESFELINTESLVSMRVQADGLVKELQGKARGLLQAAKFVNNAEMTEVEISARMAEMRASLRQLKTKLDEKMELLGGLSTQMVAKEQYMHEVHGDASIEAPRKRKVLQQTWNELEVLSEEFRSLIQSTDDLTV